MLRALIPFILVGFPLLEIVGLIEAGSAFGWWLAAWLALTMVAGLALMRQAGTSLLLELIGALITPQGIIAAPIRSHRALLAGFLLVFPGLISDAIAVVLLLTGGYDSARFARSGSGFAESRAGFARSRARGRTGSAGSVIEGDFHRES